MHEFDARVCGIPCIIRVTYWEPYLPAIIRADPGESHPPEGGEGEWEILDRRGRPAPWLTAKMEKDRREWRRVEQLVFDQMENSEPDYDPY